MQKKTSITTGVKTVHKIKTLVEEDCNVGTDDFLFSHVKKLDAESYLGTSVTEADRYRATGHRTRSPGTGQMCKRCNWRQTVQTGQIWECALPAGRYTGNRLPNSQETFVEESVMDNARSLPIPNNARVQFLSASSRTATLPRFRWASTVSWP